MEKKCTQVHATAQDVLPSFGLAFLVDDQQTTWGITKSTDGPGLEQLSAGKRVKLTVEHLGHFSIVQRYEATG